MVCRDPQAMDRMGRDALIYRQGCLAHFVGFGWIWLQGNIQESGLKTTFIHLWFPDVSWQFPATQLLGTLACCIVLALLH